MHPVARVEGPVLASRGFERGDRGTLIDLEGCQPRSGLSNVIFQGIDSRFGVADRGSEGRGVT